MVSATQGDRQLVGSSQGDLVAPRLGGAGDRISNLSRSTSDGGACSAPQMPSMTPSGKEQGFVLSDLEPTTPRGSSYYTVKTPPGLHITPGMIRSVNR